RPRPQPVLLNEGDFLLMALTRDGFKRALFADDFKQKPRDDQKDWLSAILQNARKPDGGLQMMTTFESKAVEPTADGTVKQLRPSFVWFDLRVSKSPQPLCLRWSNLGARDEENYPAPAWGMDVAEWPSNPEDGKAAVPEVEAWWLSDGTPEI